MRDCLELLLSGTFICPHSHNHCFRLLESKEGAQKAETTLHALGRHLVQTPNGAAYFAAYSDPDNPSDRKAIAQQFEQIRSHVAPVVDFLTLAMNAGSPDSVLIPGDKVTFHDILAGVEERDAYKEDLKALGVSPMFKRSQKHTTTRDRLTVVMEELVNHGYLVLVDRESLFYVVTGKMDHFHGLIQFIVDHQEIDVDNGLNESRDQMGMAL